MFSFNRNHAAIGIFCFAVLLLTRLDYLINSTLYSFGLNYSEAWHQEYGVIYFLAYQLVIFSLLAYTRNPKLFIFFEACVLTSTQDLLYFGLWQGSFPTNQWFWTTMYKILGFWNTASQILLSALGISSILILLRFVKVPVWMRTDTITHFFFHNDKKRFKEA